MRRVDRPRYAGLVLALVLIATSCELVTINRVNELRAGHGLPGLATSAHLTDRARLRAAAACTARSTDPTPDLAGAYLGEPTTALVELVGAAPLDRREPDELRRQLLALDIIWAQWRDDPRLRDPRWESIGVGQHVCPDGRLYSVLVLRDDAPPITAPADTSRVVAAGVTERDGWTWRRYRNLAAPCAISGYQSFLLGERTGSDPGAVRPLWVRMRGGGVGYFEVDGTPMPSSEHKTEESLATQLNYVDDGVAALARASDRGFRVLVVSMCSHDIYAGNDTFDPFNPNVTPDGRLRTTNGLAATKAAIAFARQTRPTGGVILHGTSAGGYGVYHVAWALQRQGRAPAAVISDSGVMNQDWFEYVARNGIPGSSGCTKNTEGRGYGVLGRSHPEFMDRANQPHLLVAQGRLRVPVMHVWNRGDHALCGSVPMPCPLPDGSSPSMWAADCQHEPMRRAIESLPTSSPSTYLRLCVEGTRPEPCDRHVPTRQPGTNTDPGAPADYNAAIFAWVELRLDEAR